MRHPALKPLEHRIPKRDKSENAVLCKNKAAFYFEYYLGGKQSPHHQMQIIKLPCLLHTIIAEPVEAHNTDLRFIERITVIGNTVHQCVKLLLRAVPVE